MTEWKRMGQLPQLFLVPAAPDNPGAVEVSSSRDQSGGQFAAFSLSYEHREWCDVPVHSGSGSISREKTAQLCSAVADDKF